MSNIASITCTAEESAEFDALSEKDKEILKWNLERFDVKEVARPVVRNALLKVPSGVKQHELFLNIEIAKEIEGRQITDVMRRKLRVREFYDIASRLAVDAIENSNQAICPYNTYFYIIPPLGSKRRAIQVYRPSLIDELCHEIAKELDRYGCFVDPETGERGIMRPRTNWDLFYGFLWDVPRNAEARDNAFLYKWEPIDNDRYGKSSLLIQRELALRTRTPYDMHMLTYEGSVFCMRVKDKDNKPVVLLLEQPLMYRTKAWLEFLSLLKKSSLKNAIRVESTKRAFTIGDVSIETICKRLKDVVIGENASLLKRSRSNTGRYIAKAIECCKTIRKLEGMFMDTSKHVPLYLPSDELTGLEVEIEDQRAKVLKWLGIELTVKKLTS
jgi:hypothetical protein